MLGCPCRDNWDKVFNSGLRKFFKGCHPQNLLSLLLNTLSELLCPQILWLVASYLAT